eukprot:6202595-Pleurochrysis_carterae.AAC.2
MRPSRADRSCLVDGVGTPHLCSVRMTASGYAIADVGFAAPPALPAMRVWTYRRKAASNAESVFGDARASLGVMTGLKFTMLAK